MDFLYLNPDINMLQDCTGHCTTKTCTYNTCGTHCFANVHCNPRMDPYFKDTPSN